MGTYNSLDQASSAYLKQKQQNKDISSIIDTSEEEPIKDPQALKTIQSIVKHKKSVKEKLDFLTEELKQRAEHHDDSKLEPPEIDWLIEMDKEPRYPYGSPEYFDKMQRWKKFFDHHYANNRHHPDHFKDLGIVEFNLADLCEYLMDICSYFDEMHVSDAIKVVEQQQERFHLDDQLTQILKNTLIEYYSWIGETKPIFQRKS